MNTPAKLTGFFMLFVSTLGYGAKLVECKVFEKVSGRLEASGLLKVSEDGADASERNQLTLNADLFAGMGEVPLFTLLDAGYSKFRLFASVGVINIILNKEYKVKAPGIVFEETVDAKNVAGEFTIRCSAK